MKKLYRIIILSSLFAFAAVLTVFSERASDYAREGLRLCAFCIVPSLFPYMVISKLIISGSVTHLLGRLVPISKLYGLPRAAGTPLILGALCGFPVGAKAACEAYEKGLLSKDEAEALIGGANNTGPSFVVSVIGASFFKSTAFGWRLYGYQLIASVIASVLINRILFPVSKSKHTVSESNAEGTDFFRAVSDSVSSVLTVCGFIVFFCVISGFTLPYLNAISPTVGGIFSAILEFTSGAEAAEAIGGARGRFLCGLCIGWSGISVFCQTAAFTAPLGLSLKKAVLIKSVQGILTGFLAASDVWIIPSDTAVPIYKETFALFTSNVPTVIITAGLYLFLIKKLSNNHKI